MSLPAFPSTHLLRRLACALTLAGAVLGGSTTAWGHGLTPPQLVEVPPLKLPPGVESSKPILVEFVLLISNTGEVKDAELAKPLSEKLAAAALAYTKQLRYVPARRNGKVIASKIRARFRFAPSPPKPKGGAGGGSVGGGAVGGAKGHSHKHSHRHSHKHRHGGHKHQAGKGAGAHGHGGSGHSKAGQPGEGPADESLDTQGGDQVYVEGQRNARGAADLVQKRDILEAAPHKSGAELLTTVPGLFLTQHSGEGKAQQIFFRGFDAIHGQDLEIWVGGAPVNEVSNLHGQGYADLHFVMPEVVSAIEALPGPYDPRQGDFAVAGTVKFRLGLAHRGVMAKAGAGSFGGRRIFLGYRPKNAEADTFAAFEAYRTDGFGPNRAASRANAMAQGVLELGPKTQVRILGSAYAGRFESAGVIRLDDLRAGRIDRFGSYDTNQGGFSARSQLVIDLTHRGRDELWQLAPYYVRRSLQLRSNFTGFLLDEENGDRVQQENGAHTLGFVARYQKRMRWFGRSASFEVGARARYDAISQSQSRLLDDRDSTAVSEFAADIDATNLTGYGDLSFKPFKRLRLHGGVRADGLSYLVKEASGSMRSAQGTHLGAKATADLRIARGLHGVVSYGDGFRSPQARSMADGEKTPFTQLRAMEVGMRYRQGYRLDAQVSLFRTTLSDDLVFDQESARNERVPSTAREGLSAAMQGRLSKHWLTNLSFTYTRARFTASSAAYQENDLLPYVPQIVARTDLAYRHEWPLYGRPFKLQVGTGTGFLGRRPLPFGEIGEDIFTVDSRITGRYGAVELAFDAYNLLNADYFDGQFAYASRFSRTGPASLAPGRHVTVGPPRILFLTLGLYL